MPPPDPNAPPGGMQGLLGNLFPGNNPAALYQGALTDPATQQQLNQRGLLALAGGFADAAMPSRMPIPFGAALGHAAAAMGPAEDAVMAARLQAAQQQQASAQAAFTMQNLDLARQLPGILSEAYSAATPTVPGTLGNPTVATVPHDMGPGWMPGFGIPPDSTGTATMDPKLSGSENLKNLANAAIKIALPGYTIQMTSGYRPGAEVGGGGGESQHAKDNAADFQIYGPDGKPIAKEGPDTTGAYGKLALTMYKIASPDIKPWLAWGGNFSTRADTDTRDLMHFDFAGDRGRFGTLAQMEQQWIAANQPQPGGGTVASAPPSGPPAAFAGTRMNTPGSWYGNSPGWTDKTDRGLQANGQPVSAGPGIALPIPKDSPNFGQMYAVTAPNGKTLVLPQTEVGPGAKGRGIDINSVAAAQFGYQPGNFPTDANFSYVPVGSRAAPPTRYAQNAPGGTFSDAQPGLPAPSGGAPPGPTPLVTPPGPGPAVPPITQPQAAPTAASGTIPGAPSPQQVTAAKRAVAILTVMGRPVPPDLAEIATWDIKGAEALREAQIKMGATAVRPSGSFPVVGPNGQVIGWQTAPAAPQLGTVYNPQTERPEIAGITPQAGAPPIVSPTGMPSAPSEQEKAAAATRGKYATGVPGNPTGAPGTVYPQGVDPTKPTPSPANAGRSYQTVIPPIAQQAGAPELNTYGQSMPAWQTESGDLADAGVKAQNAEVNLNGIIKAYSMVETGTWATQKAEFTGILKTLGLPVDTSDLAAIQTGLHNLYKETLQDLAGANKRFTGNEFKVNTEAGASAGNQPAANLTLLAQDLGRLRQMQALATDWNHARTIVGSDGSYWYNPDSFKTAWINANPLQPMVEQARKEIAPFIKGTPGFVPPDLPSGTTALPPVNGRPVYQLPDGTKIHPK